MRLTDYLALVRRRFALFVGVMGVVALISLGLNLMQDPVYESVVKLRARPPAPGSLSQSFSTVLEDNQVMTDIFTEAELVKSHEVAKRVAEELGLQGSPSSLSNSISVAPVRFTMVLEITARAPGPIISAQLANTFAGTYLESRRNDVAEVIDRATERLSGRLQDVSDRLTAIDERIAAAEPDSFVEAQAKSERDVALADLVVIRTQLRDLSDRSALDSGFGEIISPATGARAVRDTSPTRSLVFGVLLGGPVALAIILLLDSLSETIRSKDDAEELTTAEVLALVPAVPVPGAGTNGSGRHTARNGGLFGLLGSRRNGSNGAHAASNNGASALPVDVEPFSPAAEAYRTGSLNLAAVAEEAGARTILVAGPVSGEGTTTTAASLAISHAERGQKVVLVSGDLRRPDVHDLIGAEQEPGLSELLQGKSQRNLVQKLRTHLEFVGSGSTVDRPDQVLAGANLRNALNKLASGAKSSNGSPGKVVLVDSAPVLGAAETLALARAVDGVVLVVRAGVTRRQAAARAVEQIRRAGGQLLGVVLVGATEFHDLGRNGRRRANGQLSVVTNGSKRELGDPSGNGAEEGAKARSGNGAGEQAGTAG